MTTARCKIWIGSALCLLIATSASQAQETSPRPALRRVVLLPPPIPDAAMQKWLALAHITAAQRPRKGGLLGLFSPKKPAPRPPTTAPVPKKGTVSKLAPLPEATPEQLHALCEALLYEDLTTHLRTKRHLILPTETEVRTALTALHLTPSSLQKPEAARRLGQELDCDAVLIPELTHLERFEGAKRTLILRGKIHCMLLDSPDRPGVTPSGRYKKQNTPALPPVIPFFGMAAAGPTVFQEGYSRTAVELATEAAEQAAGIASHTFWTGEVPPFVLAEERVALLPLPAPSTADALLFTTTGRRVAPAAVRDLPTDQASHFRPEISPLSGKEVVPVERARAQLQQEGITVGALWRQDQPEIARVQALGEQLHVTYIIMAQITSIELQTGTPDAGEAFATREARAEAVGAFVRVSDGAILWQDHTAATMTLHPTGDKKSISIDRQAVEQAEHFALTALQGRFRAYRNHFEN